MTDYLGNPVPRDEVDLYFRWAPEIDGLTLFGPIAELISEAAIIAKFQPFSLVIQLTWEEGRLRKSSGWGDRLDLDFSAIDSALDAISQYGLPSHASIEAIPGHARGKSGIHVDLYPSSAHLQAGGWALNNKDKVRSHFELFFVALPLKQSSGLPSGSDADARTSGLKQSSETLTRRSKAQPKREDRASSRPRSSATNRTQQRGTAESDDSHDHVFLSYVREDAAAVDSVQRLLEDADLRVWRDLQNLWPGDIWRDRLQSAIQREALAFVPCFSANVARRKKSTMYEELRWAAEEYRRRRPGDPWIFPVLLDDSELPPISLGAGLTLNDLQWTRLQDGPARGVRLIQAIQRLFEVSGSG